jgi:predicted DNA-binding protein
MPNHNPSETFSLQISTQLDADLAARAVQEGKTKAQVVTAALNAYLGHVDQADRTVQALSQLERLLLQRLVAIEKRLAAMEAQANPASPTPQSSQNISFPSNSMANSIGASSGPSLIEAEEEETYDEPDEILEEFLPFA